MSHRFHVRGPIMALAMLLGGALAVIAPPPVASAAPPIRYTTVVSGLSHPWDIAFIGDLMLYDERNGNVWSKRGSATPRRVAISGFPSIYVSGEGGLLGLVVDPNAATSSRFYTCQATRTAGGSAQDVRVLRWRLTSDATAVPDNQGTRGNVVVAGLPLSSGRHSGCRLRFGTDGKLYVGTGDAAVGTNPQDLGSLGGKVLRVGWDGAIPTDNPFSARGGNARYVWTYGHRNVQGLALRPGTSQLWSVEHGSSRDDEVNLISKGANYGWNPVPANGGAGYNEAVPMTDRTKYPDAKVAMWTSGPSTIATSGAAFVQGAGWGEYQGQLAVGVLKDQHIRMMKLDLTGKIISTAVLPGSQSYGRIRAVQLGPDGSLYFTTDGVAAGSGGDKIVKITPTSRSPHVPVGQVVNPVGVSATRTGTHVYVVARSTGDRVYYKRSTDDGVTWGGWVNTGVTSTNAPSVTSSAPGRIDLFTRSAAGRVVHTWFVDGNRRGQANLSGTPIAQNGSSLGDGTIDVFAPATTGAGYRKHFDGTRWSGWRPLGGTFTSGLSASVNLSTKVTTVTGRGTGGGTNERTFTATSDGTAWVPRLTGQSSYNARSLGDTWTGVPLVGLTTGPERVAVVQRDAQIMAVPATFDSATDVVTRPNGTFILLGRSTGGALWIYDTRPGGFRMVSLGGVVR